ncbi:MarR family transcriptional regulator [Dendrosporobacter sp. 1207_IL3150]|uniref:MarR family transcriptional regulator n=1 Tax=Dendrosporobacter sp. 1207_IL3150 TaxID=3084054 RepID=UPI002FDA21D6
MQNREKKIQNLINELEVFTHQLSDLEEYEKQVLENALLEQGHEELRNVGISLVECHVIDCIERNEMPNTTAIAQKLNITKGGISKITTKLIKKNMIEAYQLPNNQKEVYYRLTTQGRKVFELHVILHQEAKEVLRKFFSVYSQNELELINRFLADINATIRTTTGAKPDVINKCQSDTRDEK